MKHTEIIFEYVGHYQIESMSDEELRELTRQQHEQIYADLEAEYNELNQMYMEGDRDMYPPDWWDMYVFPVSCQLRRIKNDFLDSNEEQCSESED